MAKKELSNAVTGLLSSFIEEPEKDNKVGQVVETLCSKKKGRGRPRTDNTILTEGSGNIRTSIIVKEEVYNKFKSIAQIEGASLTDLASLAFGMLVEKYEKAHGEIIPTGKKRDLKDIF